MRSMFGKRSPRAAIAPAFIGRPESRDDLLLWAAQHNYPALEFTGAKPVKLHPVQGLPEATQFIKYAIGFPDGDNKTRWETAVHLGKDDMIDGLIAHIKSLSED